MKLLIVDDEQDIQLLFQQKFRRELKSSQIELHFVFSGEQALDFLQNQGAADRVLILSDINMPGMTGIELLKKIKERFSRAKVFLITAYGDENNYQTAITQGADDYITKPIDFAELKKKLLGA
jgi:CheY-like chemotaxis protein